MRFRYNLLRATLAIVALGPVMASATDSAPWPEWTTFSSRFIQADGRVIDLTFDRKSTSEGQSYALFFALVANRREQFDTLLKWTSDNLASGQLGARLPAWLWGLRDDGSWGVKDQNSAADADLWMAYTLLEAGRLWQDVAYTRRGMALLEQVRRHEVTEAGRAGTVLLPGAVGFTLDRGRVRLNPSYQPGFMFRYLAQVDPKGPWQAIWDGYLRQAPAIFSSGVAPDLFVVDAAARVMPDSEREPSASYDAIRVYLWAGMSGANSAELRRLLPAYPALLAAAGVPPEKVNPLTGVAVKSDFSPLGFSGAMLPFLKASGAGASLEQQRRRLAGAALRARLGEVTHYYDQVLILFGQGWLDGHYRFDEQGRLQPQWQR
jgi:endoglucanase